LCRPGQGGDPCTDDLTTTVESGKGGTHIVPYSPAAAPSIDCFYLYPNVSLQKTVNADLHVDPQETAIAELQASPFSRDCRVFAPMYREVTSTGREPKKIEEVAYSSVQSAWLDYLHNYNDGRGVVLIGHSEGAAMLVLLIQREVDFVPASLRLLVSAILTGGDILVPVGADSGGFFTNVPACRSDEQTGCVVAYDSFTGAPPPGALFGQSHLISESPHPHQEVLCTNPANLAAGSGQLHSLYRTRLPAQVPGGILDGVFGAFPPVVSTPWVELDARYSASCVDRSGFDVLIVRPIGHATPLVAIPTPAWGLHVDDLNVALGDLVDIVAAQAGAYLQKNSASQ